MKLYVDLDQVLANFDAGYEALTGAPPCREADNADWAKMAAADNFYLNLPPMPDAMQLWGYIERYCPIVLTGIPYSVPNAAQNKREWVWKNLMADAQVITCRSADKCLQAEPGDILIDDWEKYKDKWVAKGGVWVTHVSAADTIRQLKELGL